LAPKGYYFNVARIEPENNIHVILEAFASLPNKQLVLVGNWHKNQYGEALLEKYKGFDNIKMMNPIYEPKEINLLRSNCMLYIHPHSVGGTNPSLVEAMYLGLPIVAFDVVYNRATTEEKAFYFKDAYDLQNVVNTKEIEFTAIAKEMKEIADRRYRWEIISNKYCELY
jgi:glycosyltransferase involved in cell wall biosynthesis